MAAADASAAREFLEWRALNATSELFFSFYLFSSRLFRISLSRRSRIVRDSRRFAQPRGLEKKSWCKHGVSPCRRCDSPLLWSFSHQRESPPWWKRATIQGWNGGKTSFLVTKRRRFGEEVGKNNENFFFRSISFKIIGLFHSGLKISLRNFGVGKKF